MHVHRVSLSALMVLAAAVAHADVTVQEQTTVNVAMIKAHGSSTRAITDDKERSESEFHCEGFMSMFCGKNSSLEIVRIDRGLTMSADTKKKTYLEKPFPTPEQIKAAQEHLNAVMEKMKSCPAPPAAASQPTVDTSKCTMSAPTSTVTTPGDTATFAGHPAHHTIITMTQSCANPDTGESCDMSYSFDVWSANEDLPEMATRQTFTRNYMHAMGMDEAALMATAAQFSQFLAPYKDAMKKLSSDSSSLKGYPLKTTFRVAVGGTKCKAAASSGSSAGSGSGGSGSGGNVIADASGAAAGAAASTTAGVADAAASEAAGRAAGGGAGGAIANSAAGAFASKLIGGMFSHKKSAAPPPPQGAGAGAGASSPAPMAPGMLTIAEVSMETTSISAAPIDATQFEMPPDYKKVPPPPEKPFEEPTCPKYGP
jgi:hypothetical protein